jgi:hypothetical protein
MGDVFSFKESKDNYLVFYEVTDQQTLAVWGGSDTAEAIRWFRQAPDQRLFVSMWEAGTEDDYDSAALVSSPIEITDLIVDTIKNTLERAV